LADFEGFGDLAVALAAVFYQLEQDLVVDGCEFFSFVHHLKRSNETGTVLRFLNL
jgi:hypothetical protein